MGEINPQNRRTVSRYAGDTLGPVRICLEGGELVATVQDISVEGIGILTCRRLEPGTSFVLEPAEPYQSLSPELKAEVRHTTKSGEDDYLVGCRFSRLLTLADVTRLG